MSKKLFKALLWKNRKSFVKTSSKNFLKLEKIAAPNRKKLALIKMIKITSKDMCSQHKFSKGLSK